jgi:hypothetical protein
MLIIFNLAIFLLKNCFVFLQTPPTFFFLKKQKQNETRKEHMKELNYK